jgi:hypothetical protein
MLRKAQGCKAKVSRSTTTRLTMNLRCHLFFSNPWWFEGIFLSLQHNSINLKQKRLCGFPVNVAESNSPKIGHGTFAIPVAIVYVPHVLAIIVALTVQASNVVNAPSAIWIGNDICLFTLFLHQKH